MGNEEPPPGATAKIVTSVTLSLNPAQVETLTLADEAGSLRLALCPEEPPNASPSVPVKTAGVSIRQLLGHPSAAASAGPGRPSGSPSYPKPARTTGGVEFWDGGQRSTVHF